MKIIEIALTNRCNQKCVSCPTTYDACPTEFSEKACRKLLDWGRRKGAGTVYFGGGEPTVRRELIGLVELARSLGYSALRIITNGLMLADGPQADALVDGGANEFELSVADSTAEGHDAFTQTPGSFEKKLRAIQRLRERKVFLEATLLVTASNSRRLADMVRLLAGEGVASFSIWQMSLLGLPANGLRSLVPKMSDVVPDIIRAADTAKRAGVSLRSCHVPPCLFPKADRHLAFDPRELSLVVLTPGGAFELEDSPMEGGLKARACADCSQSGTCLGLRNDYAELHGSGEIEPIH